jgi:alkylhydroperoxidase/carboxymuconolactone decarboxylase family protein YurZ
VNIAIQTANHNPKGVEMHSIIAKNVGAKKEEILGAMIMNFHLSVLVNVLDCLPAALKGLKAAE